MNSIIYNNDLRIFMVIKNCRICDHYMVCKFHSTMYETAKKDIMYQMNEYLESNNVLEIFEKYVNCQYYKLKLKLPDVGESPDLTCDEGLISYLIRDNISIIEQKLLKEKYPEYVDDKCFFFQPDIKLDIVNDVYHLILKTTNREIGYESIVHEDYHSISEVLKTWKRSRRWDI
jgi:hypothetical protein